MIMKGIEKCKIDIKRQTKAGKQTLLMLDFDGTISPIMPTPEQAYLPKETRHNLEKINRFCPIAIISGRPLDVVQEKVGVDNFVYAGSHGFEYFIGGKFKLKRISSRILKMLVKIENDFAKIADKYPKLLIEKKPYAFTFHYKFIGRKQMSIFKSDLHKFLKPIYKNFVLRALWDKETVEIAPRLDWNKGHIAHLIYKYFQDKTKKILLPIYIGDTKTDEDAFIALKKNGITIRVGKSRNSAAKYYIKNQKQVDKFLEWLIWLK